MKKPNITEGEWQVNPEHKNIVHCKGGKVCDTLSVNDFSINHSFNSHAVANAKAISGVPKMIDALIDAHGTLESLTYTAADKFVVEEEMKNIIEALKKAGVNMENDKIEKEEK